MSATEEVEEHVHHAHEPFDKIVAGSMAIIAALLAAVSVLGQHYNTEELLKQQQASDQWAYYQAKDIRRYSAQIAQDTFKKSNDTGLTAKYAQDSNRYKTQQADIQNQAKDFEKERDDSAHRANRFHVGEVFLEVAIVFSSLSILLKTRFLFIGGIVAALTGIVWSLSIFA